LQTAAQHLVQLPAIPRRKLDLEPHASAHDSAIQPELAHAKYQHWLLIHAVTVLVSANTLALQGLNGGTGRPIATQRIWLCSTLLGTMHDSLRRMTS
jgi:hypothetical protein